MMLNIPFKTLAVLAVLAAPLLGSAQVYRYSGAGTTTRSGVLVSPYTPPPGTTPNPMNSWTYRAAEKTLPYVGATRNCAFGALAGGGFGALRGGNPYMGMATGCIGAVKPAFSMRPANAW